MPITPTEHIWMKVRMVPPSSAVCGMMLNAVPE